MMIDITAIENAKISAIDGADIFCPQYHKFVWKQQNSKCIC